MDSEIEEFVVERDHTYRAMHIAALSDDTSILCSMAEGLETLQLIDAVESAAMGRKWVLR